MKKNVLLLIAFCLVLFISCSNDDDSSPVEEYEGLEIHSINVGQGDCTLVISPSGKTMLVDAGQNGKGNNEVIPYLNSLGIDSLQYIVATHYDSDHIGGIDEVLAVFPLSRYAYDHGMYYGYDTTVTYADYEYYVEDRRRTISAGEYIDLDTNVIIRCVCSDGNSMDLDDENDRSVCLVISYDGFDYFIGGDIAGVDDGGHADVETAIAEYVGVVEGMKVNHHGSYYSSNEFFLSTLQPYVAIISCGNNGYGHPDPDVMDRLGNWADIYQTNDDEGYIMDNDIVIKSNGINFSVITDRTEESYSNH